MYNLRKNDARSCLSLIMRVKEVIIVILLSVVFLEFSIVPTHCTNGRCTVDDGKSKSCTDWNNGDKIKLLKIAYETNTGNSDHDKRIKRRWDELHGMEMPQSAHDLYVRAKNWMRDGEAERLLTEEEMQSTKNETRSKLYWTNEMKENILKMYHESDPDAWKQSKRIRELWDKQYPQYRNVTTHALMMQVRWLLSKRGGMSSKTVSLEHEEKLDLLCCYYKCSRFKYGQIKMMRELFIKKHPQYANITQDTLRHQVLYFRKKNPEIDERISREFSTSNLLNLSWARGETSGSRQEETPYIPTFQDHELHQGTKHYLGQNKNNLRIHDMTGGPSSSGYYQEIHLNHLNKDVLRESKQDHSDEGQKKSSKGKEPALDLNLHLR